MVPEVHTHHRLALSLAQALIEYSNASLILLDGEFRVVSASASFCNDFGIDCATVDGTPLLELGGGEWNLPELRSFLETGDSSGTRTEAYEFDFQSRESGLRHLVLNARTLDYVGIENTRLLLAIADVTDARAAERLKDELLREKVVLLQEVQHRVGNSLQIIASVLLQRARTVQSDETRGHLTDAHQRVMSVAALQKQLAASTLGHVSLRPYLEKLCATIGASMIHDPNLLQLKVDADESTSTAEASASIGLIVTELVINSLKHAFPGRDGGEIVVAFHSDGANWTLSVSDNGVGSAEDKVESKTGLGSSIVQALASQLKASVNRTQLTPGTRVSIVHAASTTPNHL